MPPHLFSARSTVDARVPNRDSGQPPDVRALLAMLETNDAHELICEAYTYGYPLVLMDVTRRLMTDVKTPGHGRAPINQFAHATRPTPTDARHPNTDVLSSVAWLNLAREPVVVSVPDMGSRYCSLHVIDAWTNVCASIGSRTSRSGGTDVAIVGPGFQGTLPHGLTAIVSPTDMAWVIGGLETSGDPDDIVAHALQQHLALTPLGLWGHDPRTLRHAPLPQGVDATLSPSEQVAKMDGGEFFERLNALMVDNPPPDGDAPALARFAAIGIGPGLPFEVRTDPVAAKRITASAHTALARIILDAKKHPGRAVNGWGILTRAAHRNDPMNRAVAALVDLGAAPPEDLITLRGDATMDGRPMLGTDRYVIRFVAGATPPVQAFWSIAIYNAREALVQHASGRHALSSRNELITARDGTLTIYIQHESPGRARQSNWLPAPRDHFVLLMRLYWPGAAILDGSWVPPAIERI